LFGAGTDMVIPEKGNDTGWTNLGKTYELPQGYNEE
jgi:hypothetical protein